jgi:ComF family protein
MRVMSSRTARWTGNALGLVFPPTCVLCGAPGDAGLDICAGCRSDLPRLGLSCVRCALPLPEVLSSGGVAPEAALCGGCRHKPPPFERTHAAFRYEQALPALVGALKFRGRLNTLRLMGQLLAEALIAADAEQPEVIVPVPLHPKRLRERGYDQAAELARVVAGQLHLPVLANACERVRYTLPQTELEAKARQRNPHGAFRATGDLRSKHLAILDDVVTTGSTVSEVARVLKRAGAKRVDVWCLARTP